jgi:hypothetical protein
MSARATMSKETFHKTKSRDLRSGLPRRAPRRGRSMVKLRDPSMYPNRGCDLGYRRTLIEQWQQRLNNFTQLLSDALSTKGSQ